MKKILTSLMLLSLIYIFLVGAETSVFALTNSNPSQVCPAPNCIGSYVTGEYRDDGCPVFKCPDSTHSCPESCICSGETTTCPTEQQPKITTEIKKNISTQETSTSLSQEETSITSTISISKTGAGGTSIQSGKVGAITSEKIFVTNSKLIMQTSRGSTIDIKVMPEEAIAVLDLASVQSTELKEESEKAVYLISGIKKVKVIAIFPVEMKVEAKVSAETGERVLLKKPWWSFLAKEE
jgi:hypothetical protein